MLTYFDSIQGGNALLTVSALLFTTASKAQTVRNLLYLIWVYVILLVRGVSQWSFCSRYSCFMLKL